MAAGFFVLTLAQEIYENKKFNSRIFAEFITASAGYLTVILSPGTYSRVSDQGGATLETIIVRFITMLRKRWIDNVWLTLPILALNFFIVYWLIKFKGKNKAASKINIPLAAAVSL